VLITGATGGFGAGAARRFLEEGANLVLSDLDPGRLETLARDLDAADRVVTLSGRIEDEALAPGLVSLALERFGRLDVAVNNAGIAHPFVRLPEIGIDEARRVMDINFMGVFNAMRAQLPVMEQAYREIGRKAAIVNVASVAGVVGAATGSVYAASKHAVVGLTKSAALEYARRGVRINALCPSFARTPMVTAGILAGAAREDEAIATLVRGIPMRRLAEVDEIIEALVFATSPANSFMTGQTIQVDGGLTAL
jgi:NAD(P)-dependent dehydrogenase (short-subunit alcohol dehydrogenase family)